MSPEIAFDELAPRREKSVEIFCRIDADLAGVVGIDVIAFGDDERQPRRAAFEQQFVQRQHGLDRLDQRAGDADIDGKDDPHQVGPGDVISASLPCDPVGVVESG